MADANNKSFQKFIYDPLNKLQNIGNNLSDFQEIEHSGKSYTLLGKGHFGYAEKMISKKNNCIYAIKKLVITNHEINPKDILRETEIMIYLDHDNIVKLYGYFTDKEKINKYKDIYQGKKNIENEIGDKDVICLVLEYVENGTLEGYYKKHMEKNNTIPIEQNFIIKISRQMLDALVYLGGKSIMHRDIKLDNILLDKNYNVKISDFGISALFYDQNPDNMRKQKQLFSNFSRVGRQDFVSPEIEAGNSYDFRVDTYGVGLTMLCLMSYEYPINLYEEQTSKKVYRKIDFNKINSNYNIYLKQLVLRMTANNINLRPFANEALEQIEYIEGIIKNPQNPFYKDYLDNKNEIFLKNSQKSKKKFNINLNINFNQDINNENNINNNYNNNQNNYNNNQNNYNNNQNNFNNNQNNYNNNQNNFNNNQNNYNNIQNNYNNNQNIYNNNQYYVNNQNVVNNQNYFMNQNNINFQQVNQNNQYNQNYQNQMLNIRHYSNKQIPIVQNSYPQPVPIYQYNQSNLFDPNYNFINLLHKMQMKPVDLSQSSDNIYLVINNTALIRVLQCLYEILNNQNSYKQTKFIVNEMKKYKPNISFSIDVLNILEIIGKNNSGQININDFTNIIQNFRNILITKIERFKNDINNMIPRWIFHEIFSNFNKDFINNGITWQNFIFSGLKEPEYLSRNIFPNIYEDIEQFEKNYTNLFVDNFYFIILVLTKCHNCNNIIPVDTGVSSFINLDSNRVDTISNLIKNELLDEDNQSENNNNYFCQFCQINTLGKSHKAFFNTPPFLLVNFYGPNKNLKKLENEINIGDYTLTNKGPKKYELYGFICEDQNRSYTAYINNNKNWIKYSEDNKVEQYNIGSLNKYCPHMAIYRGI